MRAPCPANSSRLQPEAKQRSGTALLPPEFFELVVSMHRRRPYRSPRVPVPRCATCREPVVHDLIWDPEFLLTRGQIGVEVPATLRRRVLIAGSLIGDDVVD